MSSLSKVTIIGPLAPPAGGMANQTKKLAEFLRDENLDVEIIRTNADYKPNFVGQIPVVRALFRLVAYIWTLFSRLSHTDIVHIMANSGWSWHLFAAPAIVIARFHNKPVIVNYRGGHAQQFFDKQWRWVNLSLSKVQNVIVPSSFLKQVFNQFEVQAEIVPNVLDQTLFFEKEKKTKSSSPHIIVTRNLEQIYGVDTAIQAFAIIHKDLPKAKLSIAGTGPEREKLKQLVKSLNLESHVVFTGKLTPAEMARLYQSSDIMINASTVDNTPNAIIESLACGTPVVTTNAGGIPNLVTDQHDALLVAIGDEQVMAENALNVLNDSQLSSDLIENGLQTVTKFYWSNVWLTLKACYDDALASNTLKT